MDVSSRSLFGLNTSIQPWRVSNGRFKAFSDALATALFSSDEKFFSDVRIFSLFAVYLITNYAADVLNEEVALGYFVMSIGVIIILNSLLSFAKKTS